MNRIVVIEDDSAILKGLEATLRSESYEVLTAGDGEDGYRLVRDRQPDLVILDLTLPKMDGYEVCGWMRRHGLVTPILMLTAHDREANRVQALDAGADDYVTKPFSVRELLARVRAILRRSEGRSDLANQRQLDDARRVQERLMPDVIPQPPGFHIAGISHPARITSGDYFDVFALDDKTTALCIADVCGKGMPAAMLMANLQAAVRSHASSTVRPEALCGHLNRLMCRNLATGEFISFFFAVVEHEAKRLVYSNAGHNQPILISGDSVTRLDRGGTVLGILEHARYDQGDIWLGPGDRLLMFTDGIIERRNAEDEEFGEARLIDVVRRFDSSDAAGLAEDALGAARHFSNDPPEDDLTVVSVCVE